MKILGIDTSTKFLSLGIYNEGKACEVNLEMGRKLSSLVTVTIDRALKAECLKISDIDYFAVGLGPGSFTGMRVGLATMKGFSWALKKPVIGISTLDILANEVKAEKTEIVPVIDAKRNLIYFSHYAARRGLLKRKKPYQLFGVDELIKQVKPGCVLLGDALPLYKDELVRRVGGLKFLDKDYWYPKARNIIALALERIKEKKLDDPFTLEPIYLYPKECQIKSVNS